MSDHSITSLIEKLEGAEVGSNRLSDEVLSACGYAETRFPMDSCTYWVHPSAPKSPLSVAQESVTTSLDAALALAERVLPGWYWRAGRTPLGHWHYGRYTYGWVHLSRTDASNCDRGDEATGWAATPALALCAAILRAQSEARV